MDANASGQYSIRHSSNSSSSAVDLSGTGLGATAPPSPSSRLSDNDGGAYTRRRLSWSAAEGGRDPPRLDLPVASEPGPSNLAVPVEDPFFSFVDRPSRQNSSLFSTTHPDASSASLLSASDSDVDTLQDDAEAHLTRKAQLKMHGRRHWSGDLSVDSERFAGVASRPRRQYTIHSPLQRTKTNIKNAFHRASVRVANVRGHRPSIRLQEDSEDSDSDSILDDAEEAERRDAGERATYRARSFKPLRGWALGFLGSTNPLRLRLYNVLIHPYACFRVNFPSLR